jgi:hypothetical protein
MITVTADLTALLIPAILFLGMTALAARSVVPYEGFVITMLVGLISLLAPVPLRGERRHGVGGWLAVTAIGIGAFAAARLLQSPSILAGAPASVMPTAIAGVAEEAFFRRLLYGWLIGFGAVPAAAGTALAFAVIHVPAYGPGVLPVDVAAGLLLAWQRWATGKWSSPAVTHVVANLLQMM